MNIFLRQNIKENLVAFHILQCYKKIALRWSYVEYEQVPTTLVEETATVTLDSETSAITVAFTNPIFKTQTEYVYN